MVNSDDQVERRWVELGPIDEGLRVVRKGLKPDERVVIGGIQRVRPGAEVKVRTGTIEASTS